MGREDKKTVHIDKDLHKIIELYKVEKDRSIEEITEELIKAGFESKREDLPNYLIEKLEKIEG